jgi:large subunit ribosomal protein L22
MSSQAQTAPSTPTVRARVVHLRVSPYKVRQVLALIRGLSAEDASRVLQLCQKDAAGDVLKLLDSAIANAENNRQLAVDELYVYRAFADEGPTRKWGQPRARGRYFRVRHRSSHVTIELARYSEDELDERRRREEATSTRRGGGAQRRRAERVRRSRAAQRDDAHDHDHDHDHDEAAEAAEAPATTNDADLAETIAAYVGPAGEAEMEATLERDEELDAADEEVTDAADDDEEESK